MNNFDSMFPNFAASCAALQSLLMPVAYLFLVTGMVLSTIAGHRSAEAVLRSLGRTIVYIIVLTQLVNWGNQIATITDNTVTNVLHANPSNVYQQYNQALQVQKSTTNQNSWWQKLFNVGTSIFEALISGLLWIFGLLASVIVFYAYLVQKFILYLGYALSPIFIGFLAIRALNSIGTNYLLSLVGVMLWPLGWGAASLVTAGLITFMTDQSFLWNQSHRRGGRVCVPEFHRGRCARRVGDLQHHRCAHRHPTSHHSRHSSWRSPDERRDNRRDHRRRQRIHHCWNVSNRWRPRRCGDGHRRRSHGSGRHPGWFITQRQHVFADRLDDHGFGADALHKREHEEP